MKLGILRRGDSVLFAIWLRLGGRVRWIGFGDTTLGDLATNTEKRP